ncbi:Appr-1-p processing domain protein [Desulfotomaculum nigrificans CO-1-SRB]|uniref:Appr-1-p processing domain protein n=1 Tax=Desulfotomaculum nigrificans (strain DSM 14880 / VKM B-2319 / CO-1-SRB) TaxID=868595 RepID=F6B2L9_DESCC|nr:macro domain-containing protein [Desulfotomaculum nigrificans]AEF93848.1 Appr-1-p processing domain protein [Desulfotomaculum nigrificans CO-1-SRB]
MKKIVSGITIQCVRGNIANQKGIDAVVNAANAWLRPGGGVAGAIHSAAGPGLVEECLPLAPIKPGQAVITGGHNLPNRYVIHCLGPVYGKDEPSDELLANCYRNALKLAEEYKLNSIAFSAISTGAFGYPAEEAAQVVLKTLKEMIPQLKSVKNIIFVLRNDHKAKIFEDTLANI